MIVVPASSVKATTGPNIISEFNLSTAFDISTATDSGNSVSISGAVDASGDMIFKADGTKFFVIDSSNDEIEQFSLSTAGDITSASADSVNFDFTSQSNSVLGMWVNAAGTKMWLASNSPSATIYQYTLSTPWVVSSASYDSKSLDVSSLESDPSGVSVSTDGTRIFFVGLASRKFWEYDMSVVNDISTAVLTSNTFDLDAEISTIDTPKGGVWSADGEHCYFFGAISRDFYEIESTVSDRMLSISGGCESPAIWSFELPLTTGDEGHSNLLSDGGATYLKNGEIRQLVSVISGLQCNNGGSVSIFADGNLEPDQTVVDNTITIAGSRKVARASIGLPYTTDIETLNLEIPAGGGTIQDKRKKITDVLVRFYKSRLPWIGPDSDNLVEMKQREFEKYGEATKLLSGDKIVNIPPSWNSNGRLFIRMRAPVPLTILGLFPNMVVEDSFE